MMIGQEIRKMTIGQEIKRRRKELNMTQKQLAAETGLAEITIRQYEAGKYVPRHNSLLMLADALGVSVMDLLPDGAISNTHAVVAATLQEYRRREKEASSPDSLVPASASGRKSIVLTIFNSLNTDGQIELVRLARLVGKIQEFHGNTTREVNDEEDEEEDALRSHPAAHADA